MRVAMKITRNGETIFGDVKEFDTAWEANMWHNRTIADSFGDDLNKVRARHTNETVLFNGELDIVEQHLRSDYTTTGGVGYIVMFELLEES